MQSHLVDVFELNDHTEVFVKNSLAPLLDTLRADLTFPNNEHVILYERCIELNPANADFPIYSALSSKLYAVISA